MFRVKKEDYNSVQFIPEYSSSSIHKTLQRRASKKRHGKAIFISIIAVIVVAIAAAAAGAYMYFTYYDPSSQFLRAFEAGDFTECQQISSENAFDPAFVTNIEASVTAAADGIVDSYKSGSLSSEEAVAQLDNYDTITDGCFSDQLAVMINSINAIESVHQNVSAAQDTFASGKYLDGINQLMTVSAAAAEQSIDVEGDIASIMESYSLNIKAALFTEFSTLIRNEAYDSINSYIDFVTGYISDTDYTAFKATVSDVQAGNTRIRAASRDARSIASQAQADADAQARSAEAQTSAQE